MERKRWSLIWLVSKILFPILKIELPAWEAVFICLENRKERISQWLLEEMGL